MHSWRDEWVATYPQAEHWELGVTWLGAYTDCLNMTYQWGTAAWENLKSNVVCLENYLELCIKAKHMYIYDLAIQLLEIVKEKMFLCSPTDMCKSIHVSTIHKSSKMKIN